MKMPSMPVLLGIGAAVVVALVVISKLHSSGSATATTAPASSATGVDAGQLASFESSVTSQLDAWEAQQAASSSTTKTTASSPLPSSGATSASNPAPVVTSARSSLSLSALTRKTAAALEEYVTPSQLSVVEGALPNPNKTASGGASETYRQAYDAAIAAGETPPPMLGNYVGPTLPSQNAEGQYVA